MKKIFLHLLIILPITVFSQINDELSYVKEVKKFYTDIFADSNQYTIDDFRRDSINLESDDFWVAIEYARLRNKIDTIDSKYMIRTDLEKLHFETLYLQTYFDSYRKKNLQGLLVQDSLGNIVKPFNQNNINDSLSIYWKIKCKLKPKDFFTDAVFIPDWVINKYYKEEDGWKKFHQIYGNFFSITLPIFNSNGDYAYFQWEYICGNLCGYGFSGIYKKVNGKWESIVVWNDWIS
jgi:hypothetical protein